MISNESVVYVLLWIVVLLILWVFDKISRGASVFGH